MRCLHTLEGCTLQETIGQDMPQVTSHSLALYHRLPLFELESEMLEMLEMLEGHASQSTIEKICQTQLSSSLAQAIIRTRDGDTCISWRCWRAACHRRALGSNLEILEMRR